MGSGMSVRRRIALIIDPTLTPVITLGEPDPYIRVWASRDGQLVEEVHRIGVALERLNAKRARPKITYCRHPELHPEIEKVSA